MDDFVMPKGKWMVITAPDGQRLELDNQDLGKYVNLANVTKQCSIIKQWMRGHNALYHQKSSRKTN